MSAAFFIFSGSGSFPRTALEIQNHQGLQETRGGSRCLLLDEPLKDNSRTIAIEVADFSENSLIHESAFLRIGGDELSSFVGVRLIEIATYSTAFI